MDHVQRKLAHLRKLHKHSVAGPPEGGRGKGIFLFVLFAGFLTLMVLGYVVIVRDVLQEWHNDRRADAQKAQEQNAQTGGNLSGRPPVARAAATVPGNDLAKMDIPFRRTDKSQPRPRLPISLPKADPPELEGGALTVLLPGKIHDLAIGGGGRYLVLHLQDQGTLAVFDVSQAKVVTSIPVKGSIQFAAGAESLMIYHETAAAIERWSLASLRLEEQIPVERRSFREEFRFAMGSASAGPLVVASDNLYLYDPYSLEPTAKSIVTNVSFSSVFEHCRVSADGRVVSYFSKGTHPSGQAAILLPGQAAAAGVKVQNAQHLVPSPNGPILFSNRGRTTIQGVSLDGETEPPILLPAVHGELFMQLSLPRRERETTGSVSVFVPDVKEPLITLNDVVLPQRSAYFIEYGNDPLSLDQRVMLVPDAKVLVTIPETDDRIELRRIEIELALTNLKQPFLIVHSKPPVSLRAGDSLSYQVTAASSAGGVTFCLAHGPTDSSLTPSGLLSWTIPDDAAFKSQPFVVMASDSSGREVFHTFHVAIDGKPLSEGDANAPKVAPDIPPVQRQTVPALPELVPPQLASNRVTIPLPDLVDDIAVGGGGRYLFLKLPRLQLLAVFDTSAARITGYVPVPSEPYCFAAGVDKLVFALVKKRQLERWDLTTFQLDAAVAITEPTYTAAKDLPGNRYVEVELPLPISAVALGSTSIGPLFIGANDSYTVTPNSLRSRSPCAFYDLDTLRPKKMQFEYEGLDWYSTSLKVAVSGDGGEFALARIGGGFTMTVNGSEGQTYGHGGWHRMAIPDATGHRLFTDSGIRSIEGKPEGNREFPSHARVLPAVHGDTFLRINHPQVELDEVSSVRSVSVCWHEDTNELVRLDEMEPVPTRGYPLGIDVDERFVYLPLAKLLVTIPLRQERLILYQVDAEKALEQSGAPYLLVNSRPVQWAEANGAFTYQVLTKSSDAVRDFELANGPDGMTIDEDGLVAWSVPADVTGKSFPVAIRLRTESGREHLHNFDLTVLSIAQKSNSSDKPP